MHIIYFWPSLLEGNINWFNFSPVVQCSCAKRNILFHVDFIINAFLLLLIQFCHYSLTLNIFLSHQNDKDSQQKLISESRQYLLTPMTNNILQTLYTTPEVDIRQCLNLPITRVAWIPDNCDMIARRQRLFAECIFAWLKLCYSDKAYVQKAWVRMRKASSMWV